MASELAANTLHADGNVEFRGGTQRPVSGCPEFWLYVRGQGTRCELICKVFDSDPGWERGSLPDINARKAESVSGRGLQVVAGLSAGQWGAHLSRGRLGCWKVQGKAVWFARAGTAGVRPGPDPPFHPQPRGGGGGARGHAHRAGPGRPAGPG